MCREENKKDPNQCQIGVFKKKGLGRIKKRNIKTIGRSHGTVVGSSGNENDFLDLFSGPLFRS